MDDLDDLERDLSDREQETFENIRKALLDRLEGEANAEEKARKAALLTIKDRRTSLVSIRALREGIENPEESNSDEVAEVLEADIEAARESHEYLENQS